MSRKTARGVKSIGTMRRIDWSIVDAALVAAYIIVPLLLAGCRKAVGTRCFVDAAAAEQFHPQPYWQEVPAAAFKFEMLPIPPDPSRGIEAFWMSKTEITWEAFDVFVYRLDEEQAADAAAAKAGVDAVTRPSKPYLPPDRGFGHEGYAAITMSHLNAAEFCKWLSAKTGRRYRLPTEQEWEHACLSKDPLAFHDFAWDSNEYGVSHVEELGDYAWYVTNADGAPHPVGTKKPNLWGLCDMHGNVAEWVDGADGKPVLKGGSYLDSAEKLKISARAPDDPAWNASDPQIPKSKWWLANGPFAGFRIVCDDAPVSSSESVRAPAH